MSDVLKRMTSLQSGCCPDSRDHKNRRIMGKVPLSSQSFLEGMQHVSNCIDGSIDCEVCVHGGGRGHCEPDLSLLRWRTWTRVAECK